MDGCIIICCFTGMTAIGDEISQPDDSIATNPAHIASSSPNSNSSPEILATKSKYEIIVFYVPHFSYSMILYMIIYSVLYNYVSL